jgi:hypothetical protein
MIFLCFRRGIHKLSTFPVVSLQNMMYYLIMSYQMHQEPLRNRKQTSDEIKRIASTYDKDLDNIKLRVNGRIVPVSQLPLEDYFDFVRKLPYKRDKEPIERVGRPAWIMENIGAGIDCKKKSVLMASYFHYHRTPYRLVGSSRRPDKQIHHIFTQMLHNGEWINMDATYSNYKIAQVKHVTAKEIL